MLSSVCVVIPAYNAEATIAETLTSLKNQTQTVWEAIVIDDGSTDRTYDVAADFAAADDRVRVIRQVNAGESAARNTGLAHATGEWLVFLDADDWLLPRCLERLQAAHATLEPVDVVHCGWAAVGIDGSRGRDRFGPTDRDLFPALSQSNCLVIHTCLLRRTWVDTVGGFDPGLTTCADWDLWQRIARAGGTFALVPEVLACYRLRPNSAGTRARQLLVDALTVIGRGHGRDARVERPVDRYIDGMPSEELAKAQLYFLCWSAGLSIGRSEPIEPLFSTVGDTAAPLDPDIVSDILYEAVPIPSGQLPVSWVHLWLGVEPAIDAFLHRAGQLVADSALAGRTKARLMRSILSAGAPASSPSVPPLLPRSTEPVSLEWGYDRGLPVDRYYIERFLAAHAQDIRGRVLEIGDNTYSCRYGGDRVTTSDVLHATGHPQATFVGDLSAAPAIPTAAFDCVILTQTLQFIYDIPAALRTAHRILRPAGVMLATFPGISRASRSEWAGGWFWRFTPDSARRLFGDVFEQGNVQVTSHGNVLAACAFLYGMAAEELLPGELSYSDPEFDVILSVRAVKSAEEALEQ